MVQTEVEKTRSVVHRYGCWTIAVAVVKKPDIGYYLDQSLEMFSVKQRDPGQSTMLYEHQYQNPHVG